jgi:hypothetical protein
VIAVNPERALRRAGAETLENGAACGHAPPPLKRPLHSGSTPSELIAMVAIGTILVFVVVFALLNRIEFGRFD